MSSGNAAGEKAHGATKFFGELANRTSKPPDAHPPLCWRPP